MLDRSQAPGDSMVTEPLTQQHIDTFRRDGVVVVRQALHPEWLLLIELGLARVLGDPSVTKHRHWDGQEGEFRETIRNFDSAIEIRRLLYDSPLADMMGALMGSAEVWYYSDEFFINKAIGWALREYSKTDADAVRAFVAETDLAPLSRREALKWLARQEKRG